MQLALRIVSAAALSSILVACMTSTVDGSDGSDGSSGSSGTRPNDPPECTEDAQCAHRDTDQDVCTTAICQYGKCVEKLVKNTPECQCHEPEDCIYYEKKACTVVTCEAHICKKSVAPAGPAKEQKAGDCAVETCDGISENATKQYDAEDLGDTSNPCVVKSCDEAKGIQTTMMPNGTACGDGSVCFQGKCFTCKPQNPTSCGGEGPGEPANDSSSSPGAFPQHTPVCAFTSGSDVDWYTFKAEDKALTYDVFDFRLWSTAPTLEVCIYAKCLIGSPGGDCGTKKPGPNGSEGCCWSGDPATLHPYWDLDCTGTSEDSATAYVSVRAPGAGACEPYAIIGGY
jgi:hypothetical protein